MSGDYSSFSVSRLPEIRFGSGCFKELPDLIKPFGRQGILVTGKTAFLASDHWQRLGTALARQDIHLEVVKVHTEPDPEFIDNAVSNIVQRPDFVIAIGGGSALDTGKAIAGLASTGDSIMDYLEDVGLGRHYTGPALPMIAVPTTAGTGSEATKNAVVGKRCEHGYKKSFRDVQLVPRFAVVDPDLLESCPKSVIAANGMDALTQLLEAFVSTRASAFTDALAQSGLKAIRDGLLPMFLSEASDPLAREKMAYAALLSGIVLAQAGLGSVHGLAAPLGAFFPIPHGTACGTLVAEAVAINARAMGRRDPGNNAIQKYRRVAELLSGQSFRNPASAIDALHERLKDWTRRLEIPRLSRYGVKNSDLLRIVANARGNSMTTNPIRLLDEEIAELVERRL